MVHAQSYFFHNSRNSRALIGKFTLSVSGQTHEFIIYAMRQQARADNLAICYHKNQIDVMFSCVWPVMDHEFRHNIVKVAVGPRGDSQVNPLVFSIRGITC